MKMVQWLLLSSLFPFLMAVAAAVVGLMEDQNNSRWANITHHQFVYSPSIPISYTVRQFIYWDTGLT
jgi:hypothetical protein